MGTWTAAEFNEAFGGWPDENEHSVVPSAEAIDYERKRRKEEGDEPPNLPDDHPGFIDCKRCSVGVRADLFTCPACGADT